MALKIADLLFTGPHGIDETVVRKNHDPVVYAVLSKEGAPWDPIFRLVDVGYSEPDGIAFARHPRRAAWQSLAAGTLCLYLLPMPESAGHTIQDRRNLAEKIRALYSPPNDRVSIAQ